MIKLEILKYEKCQPPPPFKKTFPCTILSPPFLIFQNPGLMGEVIPPLSINPSATIFVFGDFNVHHKDWHTYSGGADRFGELL